MTSSTFSNYCRGHTTRVLRLRHIESSPNFCQQAPARSQTNRYATGEVEAYLPSNHLLFVGGRQRQAGVEAGDCRSGCRCINIFGGLTGGHKVQLTATHADDLLPSNAFRKPQACARAAVARLAERCARTHGDPGDDRIL